MALNPKIVEKVMAKTTTDNQMRLELLDLLSKVEEGKQAKRLIEKIINNHAKMNMRVCE